MHTYIHACIHVRGLQQRHTRLFGLLLHMSTMIFAVRRAAAYKQLRIETPYTHTRTYACAHTRTRTRTHKCNETVDKRLGVAFALALQPIGRERAPRIMFRRPLPQSRSAGISARARNRAHAIISCTFCAGHLYQLRPRPQKQNGAQTQ